jgi:FixJ family two-component response regulator
MNKITNVYVVDDDDAVRKSLRMLLKTEGYTVATFPSADEFLAVCNQETTGCIILDVNMPEMDGPAMQEELNRRGMNLPIIFLTGQGSIPITVRALKAGAMDFLTKPVDGAELLACVKQALEKCADMQKQAADSQFKANRLATLTEREKEILSLIVAGYANKDIAERLGISFRTVETHRAHIMEKTGASNLKDLLTLGSQ